MFLRETFREKMAQSQLMKRELENYELGKLDQEDPNYLHYFSFSYLIKGARTPYSGTGGFTSDEECEEFR